MKIQTNTEASHPKIEASPKNIIRSLIDISPKAKRETIYGRFRAAILASGSEDELDAVIEFYFSRNYPSMVQSNARVIKSASRTVTTKAERAKQVAAVSQKVKQHIQLEAEKILMDFVMPSGKTLRDSTGADCRRAGGWLSAVAARLKPNQKVGTSITEQELRDLRKQN